MIWLDYLATLSKAKKYTLMGGGIALLIALAIIYKGGDPADPTGMDPSWWGILGIIGWAYLVCAIIYLVCKGRLALLVSALVIFIILNILLHAHIIHGWLWLIGDASSVALVMGGIVISELYALMVTRNKTQLLWPVLLVTGVACIVIGIFIRPYTGGISKIHSTPAWVFVCSGITILMFVLLIYLVDVKGKKDWFKRIAPAGTSTLTCYLIPYYQYFIFRLCHVHYADVINEGAIGLLRSAFTAIVIVLLVGLMEKRHLRLKI
jgi:heparan-alpha-glucosaminide N-acetyltransferase